MTPDEQLDRRLAACLRPPPLPRQFTARWQAAIEAAQDDEAQRRRLEGERRVQLEAFREEFVRMRRRTFATCLGVAFVAGAAASAAMPWLARHYGSWTELVVPLAVAAGGVVAGVLSAGRHLEF